jgi:hypothetical protein
LYFCFASGVAELVVFAKQLKQVLTFPRLCIFKKNAQSLWFQDYKRQAVVVCLTSFILAKQKYFGGTNARFQRKHLMLLRINPQ